MNQGKPMLIRSPRELAHYCRDQRKQHKITQNELSSETSLRQDTISKFELKPDNVRLETLFRLLSALELELHLTPKDSSENPQSSKSGWTEQW
jgi:HTH-type transcriptional regulator/antitoxin HipB